MVTETKFAHCPDDGQVTVDGNLLVEMVADCEKDALKARDVQEKIKCYLRMADLCRANDFAFTAFLLCHKAWDLAIDDDYEHLRMKNKEFALTAAGKLNGLVEKLRSEDMKAKDFVRETLDYYHDIYCVRYID